MPLSTTKDLLILKRTLHVTCKIWGREATLGNFAFSIVGQAVEGAYCNPFPAGTWGKGFPAARAKPSLEHSKGSFLQCSLPQVSYSSTVLQTDVSPSTRASGLPATKHTAHPREAMPRCIGLRIQCSALALGGCWENEGFIMHLGHYPGSFTANDGLKVSRKAWN